MDKTWDVIIAGGSFAGLSAALMLGRARRRVLVIDAGAPRNRFAAHMHGVLGHDGLAPTDLLERGRKEAADYGVVFASGEIADAARSANGIDVVTVDGEGLSARALIAATGLRDELPPIAGLAERWGTSVLHCPYCHGWEVRDRAIGVLTTSARSAHQVELLRQWTANLTVFAAGLGEVAPETTRRWEARGLRIEHSPVVEILGDGRDVAAVRLADDREVSIEALFTAGTPRPHDAFLAGLDLARTDTPAGSFLTIDPTGRTSDDRVWAVGDLINPGGNVALAIGSGSLAGAAVNAALVTADFDAAVTDA